MKKPEFERPHMIEVAILNKVCFIITRAHQYQIPVHTAHLFLCSGFGDVKELRGIVLRLIDVE